MVNYSHAVTITSECHVKRVICKTWTATLANSADQDQMLQNAASDQGLHYLLKIQEVKSLNETVLRPCSGPFSQPTLRDNQPTSAVSTLIVLLIDQSLFPVVQLIR